MAGRLRRGDLLTFDDGLASHLEIAMPELDKRGLRATLYLTPPGEEDETSSRSWLSTPTGPTQASLTCVTKPA